MNVKMTDENGGSIHNYPAVWMESIAYSEIISILRMCNTLYCISLDISEYDETFASKFYPFIKSPSPVLTGTLERLSNSLIESIKNILYHQYEFKYIDSYPDENEPFSSSVCQRLDMAFAVRCTAGILFHENKTCHLIDIFCQLTKGIIFSFTLQDLFSEQVGEND